MNLGWLWMKNEYRNAFDYFENNERKYSFNHFFDMEKIGDETQMPVEFKNEEYIIFEGYLSNAKLLYRKLISKGKYCPDNLIYPYLFSCRHCIEILLKGIIKKFFYIINAYLIKLDDGILKKIQHTHSITNLLEYFESLTSNIDDYDVLKIIQKGNYKLLHEELLLDNKSIFLYLIKNLHL